MPSHELVLSRLGWDDAWAASFAPWSADAAPGRVSRVDRGVCTALTDRGPVRATLGADMLDAIAAEPADGPCTGDWVAVRSWPDGPVTIEGVLPRRTAVIRADVRGRSRGQVLAANADVVAVVAALQPEPVIGKLERLVALAWDSGASVAVVLTKADLVHDAELLAEDVRQAAPGARVVVCSTRTGAGLAELRQLLGTGTLALLGPSGVGKSSLVNALAATEVVNVAPIRADGKGRHTTVRRELLLLPEGGIVIDTPGLRGVGLLDADGGLAATFADVEALVGSCRFSDCSHTGEPGCAVQAAVQTGTLPLRRLESWRKLQRERAWMAARTDARLRAERARRWKA